MACPDWEEAVRRRGFDAYGVCDYAAVSTRLLPCRAAARLPQGACRVLTLLFPYRFPGDEPGRNLSRYACVEDYHQAGGRVLRALAEDLAALWPGRAFEPFLDNSPLPEVYAAALCGLGVVGDNGLLIHPRYGSYVFIGTIVTDAPLPLSGGAVSGCPHCGACAAACPGGCLPGGERDTCLSALSQKKGALTPEEEEALRRGGLAWGCDACQEACPLNRAAAAAPHPCFTWYRPGMTEADLEELTGKAYGWRGKAAPLRNLRLLQTDNREEAER